MFLKLQLQRRLERLDLTGFISVTCRFTSLCPIYTSRVLKERPCYILTQEKRIQILAMMQIQNAYLQFDVHGTKEKTPLMFHSHHPIENQSINRLEPHTHRQSPE